MNNEMYLNLEKIVKRWVKNKGRSANNVKRKKGN